MWFVDGKENGKHNGVSLVDISEIFATLDNFLVETLPLDSMYVAYYGNYLG